MKAISKLTISLSHIFFSMCLMTFSTSTLAVNIPSSYEFYSSIGNVTTYKHKWFSTYAVVVKSRNASVSFGGHVGVAGNDKYYRDAILGHRNQNSNAVAVMNGQFFDVLGADYYSTQPARLMFPIKSNWATISSGNYDNSIPLRSLFIDNYGRAYFQEGFSQSIFNNSSIKEYLTGIHPNHGISPYATIGRNYIGGIPSSNCNPDYATCEAEYLVFIIANKATRSGMINQLDEWATHPKFRMMMDGSGSAQFSLKTYTGTSTILSGDNRKIPHSITISN
ncbi:MAG: hypothetical protein ACI9SP_003823 [Arenicella sp.]|jgi:hypothetical protein